MKFSRHCSLCVHVTAPPQDKLSGGSELQLERAFVHSINNQRNAGIYSTDCKFQVKQLETVSYLNTGSSALQQDNADRETVLMHFGLIIPLLDLSEDHKSVFRQQNLWWGTQTMQKKTALPIWPREGQTISHNATISDMFDLPDEEIDKYWSDTVLGGERGTGESGCGCSGSWYCHSSL